MIRRFLADERGASAIEYGLICGVMAVVLVSIAATGGALDTIYARVGDLVDAIAGGDGGDDGGDGG